MPRISACSQRILSALFSILLLSVFLAPPAAQAGASPRVLAFYYAWYDNSTWTRDRVPDLPAQPYVSSDPAAMARQIGQARGAGIDAFVVSWLGAGNPTDTNFKTMLNVAQGQGFAATIDFEAQEYGTREQLIGALSYVRENLANQPAFLRDNGRPVLFFWREQNFSVEDWAQIRAAVDPNHGQVWIAEGVDISYQQVFDGHHLYSIAWAADVNYTLYDWAGRVRRAGGDKLWVATVMPGYDDTRTSRSDRFARSREGGNYYRVTWQAAMNSRPDWVIITSFNEWVEGSMIEPSVTYGNAYLDITRDMAAQFKAGSFAPAAAQPSAPSQAPVAKVAATAIPTAQPIAASAASPQIGHPATSPLPQNQPLPANQPAPASYRATTDGLRIRKGPNTDYLVLGRVNEGTALQVIGRSADSQWLQIVLPQPLAIALNMHEPGKGWVMAEFVSPPRGLETLPIIAAPALASPTAIPNSTASPVSLPQVNWEDARQVEY